jgi:ADP-ribosylglycohydrolase
MLMFLLKNHAGIACYLPQSIPLIFYILVHSNGFEEAIQFNARLGGASADRGLLLGAILSKIYEIPQSWIEKLNSKKKGFRLFFYAKSSSLLVSMLTFGL